MKGSRKRSISYKFITLYVLLCLLSACASGPRFSEQKTQLPPLNPDLGRIFFYRIPIFPSSPLKPDIVLNKEVVGQSISGAFFYVDRPPGKYTVNSNSVDRNVSFELDKGQTRYIKFRGEPGIFLGTIYPVIAIEEKALSEIGDCTFTGQMK